MVIDTHTHYIPGELLEFIESGQGPTGLAVERRGDKDPLIVHDNGLAYPVLEIFSDAGARLEQMDREGVDVTIVSLSPSLFLYWLEPEETAAACRLLNDAASRIAAGGGGRIQVMATVPMNDPEAAAAELRRARAKLGHVGVEIGTSIGSRQLDDPAFEPFFAAAEELAMPVMLHPYLSMIAPPDASMAGFHLANVVGNPVETFVGASRLIVGGVFDRHPELRVLLVHGGGAFPYQLGRLQHAYEVREETSRIAARPPISYLENLLFDTANFDPLALRFLIDRVGAQRVVYGTDLPFDMGDEAQERVREVAAEEAERLLGHNAAEAFGLEVVV